MEFKLVVPKSDAAFLKAILFNKDELITELKNRLSKYDGIAYTEEQIKDAKTDRANLNKFRDALEAERKKIKAKCLEPYEKFEADIKDVLALIDKPIGLIDGQIKSFEEQKKEEKKKLIEDFYNANIGDYFIVLPLSSIFNPKWLNATYKLTDIYNEIGAEIKKFKEDLKVISDLKTEFEEQIKDKYIQTHDLSAALAENARLTKQKADLAAIEAKRKTEAEAAAAKPKQEEPPVTPAPEPKSQNTPEKKAEESAKETICFRVIATSEQIGKLKKFLVENNIEFGRI